MPDARTHREQQQGIRETHHAAPHAARGSTLRASGALFFVAEGRAEPVAIPEGTGVLALEHGRVCARPAPAIARAPAAGTALIENVAGLDGELPRLVLVPGPGLDLRLNALPAPCLAVARVGDELWLGSLALRLVLRRVPYVGPPPERLVGRPCGVCGGPLSATTTAWICPTCGTGLHSEGLDTPEAERLDCAQLGGCPGCGAVVSAETTWIGGEPPRPPQPPQKGAA